MAADRANTFSSFLQTMSIGKSDGQPFDVEASAKLVLQHLSARKMATPAEIGSALGLAPDRARAVVAYLADAGMVQQLKDGAVTLTGFGSDALGVFAVA